MRGELKTAQTDNRQFLRAILINLQDETARRIEDLRSAQRQDQESQHGDEMDSARTTAEVETHAGLIAREEEKLRDLDEAIARFDAGKYGLCLRCKAPIPFERLMVLPFAKYCVDCQGKRDQPRGGWGEGNTIAPYDRQWTVPEEMEEPGEQEYRNAGTEPGLAVDRRRPVVPKESEVQSKHGASPKKRSRQRKN